MKNTAVFTIVSKNYISMAKTLMDSLKEHQEDWDRYVILVDDYDGEDEINILEHSSLYKLIKAVDIKLPDAKKMFFRYNILELNTAVKPWVFDLLLCQMEYEKVVYMDPDICIYDRLTEVENILEDQGGIILTPHILAPIYDDKKPTELDLMRAGIYNLGFIAVSKGQQTRVFLDWWQNKLEYGCVVDLPSGLFVDQKWMDFVPAIFNKVTILKHPGYNAAYWNLMQRSISKKDKRYFVEGKPLVFFHFSGLNPTNISNFSKHQNRFGINDIGIAKEIVQTYSEKVISFGFKETNTIVYRYDYFDDGIKINQMVRDLYNNSPQLIEKCGNNPYERSDVFTSIDAFGKENSEIIITPVMKEIWQKRHDLQKAFPNYSRSQRYDYADWFVHSAREEYGLDEVYIKPIENCLNAYNKHESDSVPNLPTRVRISKNRFHQSIRPAINKIAKKSKPIIKSICTDESWERLKNKYFDIMRSPSILEPKRVDSETPKAPTYNNCEKGVNLVAYIRGDFGVGEAGRSAASAIKQSGIPFGIINFEPDIPHNANNKNWDDFIMDDFKYNVNVFNVNADQTPVLEEVYSHDVWNGRYNIGHWVWELPEFPEEWKRHFRRYNEIWAPSRFVVEALSEKSPVPVVRIPYAIDVKINHLLDRTHFKLPEDKFLFLFMFDVMSIPARKNPEAVIKAFEMAFEKNDSDVGLVIKINNGRQTPNAVKRLRQQFEDRNNIFFIDEIMPKEEINSLINSVDSFVSLHRSEGFGLGLAESMYLGKPVIGTNWSGNTDFMNHSNSCPVDYNLIQLGQDYGPYKANQHWADPNVEHAAGYMKKLLNKDYYSLIAKNGEKTIKEEFSPEAVSVMMKKRLSSLSLI